MMLMVQFLKKCLSVFSNFKEGVKHSNLFTAPYYLAFIGYFWCSFAISFWFGDARWVVVASLWDIPTVSTLVLLAVVIMYWPIYYIIILVVYSFIYDCAHGPADEPADSKQHLKAPTEHGAIGVISQKPPVVPKQDKKPWKISDCLCLLLVVAGIVVPLAMSICAAYLPLRERSLGDYMDHGVAYGSSKGITTFLDDTMTRLDCCGMLEKSRFRFAISPWYGSAMRNTSALGTNTSGAAEPYRLPWQCCSVNATHQPDEYDECAFRVDGPNIKPPCFKRLYDELSTRRMIYGVFVMWSHRFFIFMNAWYYSWYVFNKVRGYGEKCVEKSEQGKETGENTDLLSVVEDKTVAIQA